MSSWEDSMLGRRFFSYNAPFYNNNAILRLLFLALIQAVASQTDSITGSDYASVKALEESLFSPENYSTNLRPVYNQTSSLSVYVTFSLVAIVSVDNVKQEMVTNGFLLLKWRDERISWNPADYDGFDRLIPSPKQIWRPRLILINTLDDRDPFGDDYSHTFMDNKGNMGWVPGSLLRTYCGLNIVKFPFDVQMCKIQLCPISHTNRSVHFIHASDVNLAFYYPNPGWELLTAKTSVEIYTVVPGEGFSCTTITFQLKRRSANIVFNVIIPVIFLSVLNNLVFLIPTESGEKISYAITVLLSLTVFLSMVSTMTPQVSDTVPALTIYLFVLLLSSVLTVAAAIFTVFLQHKEEREEAYLKCKLNYQNAAKKVFAVNKAVAPLAEDENPPPKEELVVNATGSNKADSPRHNKYRLISKHINIFFFCVMNALSFITTVWYITYTTS